MLLVFMPIAYSASLEIVNTNPAQMVAGDYNDITIRVTNPNTGGDSVLRNVQISIVETDFIKEIDSTFSTIRELRSGESTTGTIRVYLDERLPEGFINVRFDIKTQSTTLTNTKRVYIRGAETEPELFIGRITSVPNELLPDTKNNILRVTLQNLGERKAELIRAELVTNDQLITQSNSFSMIDSIASLESGQEAILEFKIDIKEDARDTIPSEIKLRYRSQRSVSNSFDIYEKNITLPIEITPAPLLKIDNVELLDNFQIGTTENRLRVTVTNYGQEDAQDIRIRVRPDISYPLSFESLTQYISARIRPGESATVEFKVEVLSTAQVRDYPISVRLESLVSESRYIREDVLTIRTTEASSGAGISAGIYFLLFVIVSSTILGYLIWRRNKVSKLKQKGKKN